MMYSVTAIMADLCRCTLPRVGVREVGFCVRVVYLPYVLIPFLTFFKSIFENYFCIAAFHRLLPPFIISRVIRELLQIVC